MWMSLFLHWNRFEGIFITTLTVHTKRSFTVNGCRRSELMSCEVKSCVLVINKFIIKMFLSSNHCFWLKEYSITLLSPVKKSSCLNQERNMHRSSTVFKQKESRTVLDKLVDFDVRGQQEMDFVTRRNVIIDYGLWYFWPVATAKMCCFLLHKMLMDWSHVDYFWIMFYYCFYQLFGLSFWWHPLTAEDLLVSIWYNVKFLKICFDEETNSFTSCMAWGWVHI